MSLQPAERRASAARVFSAWPLKRMSSKPPACRLKRLIRALTFASVDFVDSALRGLGAPPRMKPSPTIRQHRCTHYRERDVRSPREVADAGPIHGVIKSPRTLVDPGSYSEITIECLVVGRCPIHGPCTGIRDQLVGCDAPIVVRLNTVGLGRYDFTGNHKAGTPSESEDMKEKNPPAPCHQRPGESPGREKAAGEQQEATEENQSDGCEGKLIHGLGAPLSQRRTCIRPVCVARPTLQGSQRSTGSARGANHRKPLRPKALGLAIR